MAKVTSLSKGERTILTKKLSKVSIGGREKRIFSLKYGLVTGEFLSNKEVGRRYKITGEAVRLILKKIHSLINES